ncbi:MAG: hypothetical protein PUB85_09085 [Clostridia bacterium]|nr:hypothetical protein [Clostridia bacterium]
MIKEHKKTVTAQSLAAHRYHSPKAGIALQGNYIIPRFRYSCNRKRKETVFLKNPHRRVVLKMCHFTADALLLQLPLAYDYILLLHGFSSSYAIENRAFYSSIHSASHYVNDNQVVIDIRLPSRTSVFTTSE